MSVSRRRTWTKPIGLVAAMLLLLTACAPEAPEDDGAPDAAEDETDGVGDGDDADDGDDAGSADGGELIVATAEDPPTLESAYGYSATTGIVLRNIQEPLVGRDRETGEFVGLLAED